MQCNQDNCLKIYKYPQSLRNHLQIDHGLSEAKAEEEYQQCENNFILEQTFKPNPDNLQENYDQFLAIVEGTQEYDSHSEGDITSQFQESIPIIIHGEHQETAIIFWDLETTEINVQRANILQIVAEIPSTGASFSSFVKATERSTAKALQVHKITTEQVSTWPNWATVGEQFINWITQQGTTIILIAHNGTSFDQHVLKNECQRHGLLLPDWTFIDSRDVIKQMHPGLLNKGGGKLQVLYEELIDQTSSNSFHNAMFDTRALIQVMEKIREKKQIEESLDDYIQKYVLNKNKK